MQFWSPVVPALQPPVCSRDPLGVSLRGEELVSWRRQAGRALSLGGIPAVLLPSLWVSRWWARHYSLLESLPGCHEYEPFSEQKVAEGFPAPHSSKLNPHRCHSLAGTVLECAGNEFLEVQGFILTVDLSTNELCAVKPKPELLF